ncbi:MAG: hypothetical protein ACR652_02380 [Methylocystis sp.]|uniref:hypothetical protein n=1 Tax=Methylocystis sp. TaxID=1911079 RepID=UPI003DA69F66
MGGFIPRLLMGACIVGLAASVTVFTTGQEMSAAIPEIMSCLLAAVVCAYLK